MSRTAQFLHKPQHKTMQKLKSPCTRLKGGLNVLLILLLWEEAVAKPLDDQRIYFPGEKRQEPLDTRIHAADHANYENGGHYSSSNQGHMVPYPDDEYSLNQQVSEGGNEQHEQVIPLNNDHQKAEENQKHKFHQKFYESSYNTLPHQKPPGYPSMHYGSYASHQHAVEQESPIQAQLYHYNQNHDQQAAHTYGNNYQSHRYGANTFHSVNINPNRKSHEENELKLTNDLNSILNQQSIGGESEKQKTLHPNVKQAIDNIMKDLEKTSYNSNNNLNDGVHSIPTMSTTSSTAINLLDLLDQLYQLEQSPNHRNISWCEEKIKEFLLALQHKQANGISLNQNVQEETLHQILIHDQNSNEFNSKHEVYEPPFQKVTIKPLGNEQHENNPVHQLIENAYKEELSSDSYNSQKHQASHENAESTQDENNFIEEQNDQNAIIPTTQQNKIFSGQQDHNSQLEILSQQHQHESQSPPFVSQNNYLEETNPEIPGFIHSASEEVAGGAGNKEETEELQSNISELKNPTNSHIYENQSSKEESQHTHIISGSEQNIHYKEDNTPLQLNRTFVETEEKKQESPFIPDPNTPEGFQPRPIGQLDLELPEISAEKHEHPEKGLQPQSSDQLDLQLPEYHYSEDASLERKDGSYINVKPEKDHKDVSLNSGMTQQIQDVSVHQESSDAIQHGVYKRPQAVHNEREEQEISYSDQSHEQTASQEKQKGENSQNVDHLHNQQVNYETLIEELIQLESVPGHQAIDKCEEKILEFLEILKYQQEIGFGKNQHELARLHQTLIEQTQQHDQELQKEAGKSNVPSTSFWRKLQKKIKTTYEKAKETAKKAVGI